MKKELGEFTGKTVEEATAAALAALKKTQEEVEIEVVEKGKAGGFLGIGAVKARIKVYETVEEVKAAESEPVAFTAPAAASVAAANEGAENPTDGERAVTFLKGLLELLKINATPVLSREEEKIEIRLEAEKNFDVIGKKGIVLDSMQNLAGAVANIGREEYKRVVVDCGDYREKRDATLAHVAQKMADKAIRQGRRVRLEPMSAYERRIIHSTLADSTEVKTVSEGKEPRRYVVVIPNELKPYAGKRDYNNRRGNGNGKNYGDRRRNGDKKEGFRGNKPHRNYTEEEKRARSQVSGGTGMGSSSSYKKSSSVVFGTYLGNSRKNDENKNEE